MTGSGKTARPRCSRKPARWRARDLHRSEGRSRQSAADLPGVAPAGFAAGGPGRCAAWGLSDYAASVAGTAQGWRTGPDAGTSLTSARVDMAIHARRRHRLPLSVLRRSIRRRPRQSRTRPRCASAWAEWSAVTLTDRTRADPLQLHQTSCCRTSSNARGAQDRTRRGSLPPCRSRRWTRSARSTSRPSPGEERTALAMLNNLLASPGFATAARERSASCAAAGRPKASRASASSRSLSPIRAHVRRDTRAERLIG